MKITYQLPETLKADLESLREKIADLQAGKISAAELRAFRVPQGVYEQRQDGAFMLRVRLPAGGVLAPQMRKLSEVARTYGSGLLHVTTRQDIQVHDVPLENIYPGLVELHPAGLSAKGGGGNTVRNVTACPHAGVCGGEAFDVAPYAAAVTEFLLPDPKSFQLPRKYKIAFSGCAADCTGAAVNDLGCIAKVKDGQRGFTVLACGGMGSHSRVAHLLEEFVPAGEIHLVAEAVKRVFDKHGNRRDKYKARLRYLVRQIGEERFAELYNEELAILREKAPALPELREAETPSTGSAAPDPDPGTPAEGFEAWRKANVRAQKQEGRFYVEIFLFLGDINADTLEKLAGIVEQHGDGLVRTTQAQNLLLRWMREEELPELYAKLTEIGLAETVAPLVRRTVACTGAATCRLGICLSRGLAAALRKELTRSGPDLAEASGLRLHINGCPNACGRHPIASIGLVGAARRIGERLVPHYQVQLGGRLGAGRARLAEGKDTVPARSVPAFLTELLGDFRASDKYPDFDAYVDATGREAAARLAAKYRDVPAFTEDRNFYYDWGAEDTFSLAGRGPGECSAGVFDLIEVDLAGARDALGDDRLLAAVEGAARALLVTRGEEARDAANALRLFEKHFLDAGLVDASMRELITSARAAVTDGKSLAADPEQVAELVETVEKLYAGMDQSLRFKPAVDAGAEEKKAAPAAPEDVKADKEADFQGVTCPLNYVKTKLLLEGMQKGQVLAVLLDKAGGENVPRSAEGDGHEIVSVTQEGERWRVVLRKG